MYPRASDARRVFLEAVEKHPPADWPRFLEEATGGDLALRGFVEALLQSHRESNELLDGTGAVATIAFPPTLERPGTQIGPYRLVEKIGEGGMGVVYMAMQKEPVRRKVALKIIKPGMDSREVIARFAAEEQALALMDHPNIAHVHDAGVIQAGGGRLQAGDQRLDSDLPSAALSLMSSPSSLQPPASSLPPGRPYFVMELVNGVTLMQHCDDNNLTTRERLELFVQVCHAVQHAHQKGIIHRDLKPGNILVTLHDGVPVPKIIDFGIAKAIGGGLTPDTLATGYGQMIGTPLYMSPEQAEQNGLDIDTRSDIYSLGVLLYELLAGSTPFDREQLKDAGYDEVRRLIREQEPPRPSTRVSTLGALATTVSEHRRTSPVELSSALRHELDWIVMKALEKDRTRRYQTANDFARDIQRYLHDEAVEACPPSTAYRLKKFVRRNRTVALATTAVSLAVILGAGAATGQAYRATKAEQIAEEQLHIAKEQQRLAGEQAALAKKQKKLAEDAAQREAQLRREAEQQRDLAKQATEQAEAARGQSEAVTKFLVGIFRIPDTERDGRTLTVVEMLKTARSRIETEFGENPRLEARLLGAIAATYSSLGLGDESTELARRAYEILLQELGPQHPDTLDTMNSLADSYLEQRHWKEVLPLLHQTLDLSQTHLGAEHPITLGSACNLAEAYSQAARWDEAIALLEPFVALTKTKGGPNDPETLDLMQNLGAIYRKAGQLDKAIPLLEETLRLRKTVLAPDDPAVLNTMNSLAVAYGNAGRTAEAVTLLEQNVELKKAKLGPEHRDTLGSMCNLAEGYFALGQRDKALALAEQTCAVEKGTLGEDHPQTLFDARNLARYYLTAGRVEDAATLAERTVELSRNKYGIPHPVTLAAMTQLSGIYVQQRQYSKSQTLLLQVLDASPLDATAWYKLGLVRLAQEDVAAYQRGCHELITRYVQNAKPPFPGWELAWCCKLAPILDEDIQQVVRFARDAYAAQPDDLRVRGELSSALYRAGHVAESLEHSQALWENDPSGRLWCGIWLSMAHAQLGHVAEARKYLGLAVEEAQKGPWWDIWGELEHGLLRSEAESLLEAAGPKQAESPAGDDKG